MTPVDFYFVLPNGQPLANSQVSIQLSRSSHTERVTGITMPRPISAATDALGRVTLNLWPSVTPYFVEVVDEVSEAAIFYKFVVPEVQDGSSVRLQDIVVDGTYSGAHYDEAAIAAIQASKNAARASELAAGVSAAQALTYRTEAQAAQATVLSARDAAALSAINAAASAAEALIKAQEAAASAAAAALVAGGGVQTWNGRSGAVSLQGSDILTALGFTPYNASNPAGYVTAAANVASATRLQTARTINGVAFDGSQNIVISASDLSYTAADVLNKIKLVDGHNSGLDADLLDGVQASAFALLSGATFAGAVSAPGLSVGVNAVWHAGNFTPASKLDATANAVSATKLVTPRTINGVPFDGTGNITVSASDSSYTASDVLAKLLTLDGPGSSLDADTVDGIQASAFALLGGANFTGSVTAPSIQVGANPVWHSGNFTPSAKLDATAAAVSAARLTTPRLINGVAFDGTGDITITVGSGSFLPLVGGTLSGNFTAPNVTATGKLIGALRFEDSRAVDDTPAAKTNQGLTLDFKQVGSVANPPVAANGTYAHILTAAGWTDASGGRPSQLSFGDGLAIRQATSDTAWGPWRTVWHSGNFNPASYASASALSSYLPLAGGTLTGMLSTTGSTGVIARSGGGFGVLEVRGAGGVGDAAIMTFHRPGIHAGYFGLDTDNKWKVGGWSFGANAYELVHGGNFNSFVPAGAMQYTGWITAPGADANTIWNSGGSRTAFTYSNNAPTTGPLASFHAGGYDLQLNAAYAGGGSYLAFRTRNGDSGTWNNWHGVWHSGNFDPAGKLNLTGGVMSGVLVVEGSVLSVTQPSGIQRLLMGNRDSGGTNQPFIIQSANGTMELGRGNSWSGNGGTFTGTLFVNAVSSFVGIRTSSPQQPLHVNGTSLFDATMVLRDTAGTGAAMNRWISLQDGANAERGWMGYGFADTRMGVYNNIGPLVLSAQGTTGVQVLGQGVSAQQFSVPSGTNLSDTTDGATWYGLGRTNVDLFSAASTQVHVAGYYGLRLRSANAILDIGRNMQARADLFGSLGVSGQLNLTDPTSGNVTAILGRKAGDTNFQLRVTNGDGGSTGTPAVDLMLAYSGTSNNTAGLRFYRGGGALDSAIGFFAHNSERMWLGSTLESSVRINVRMDGQGSDPYGPISVTRDTLQSWSYYGLTRAGQVGMALGIDTSNRFIIGTGSAAAGAMTGVAMSLTMGGRLSVADGFNIQNGNTYLGKGSADALRVSTPSGWLDVGAMNAGFAHIQTDRPAFYFNKPVRVDGELTNYTANVGLSNRIWSGWDAGVADSISTNNWFRSSGPSGWFNSTYSGGIYMTDASWIRTYNGRGVLIESGFSSYGMLHLVGQGLGTQEVSMNFRDGNQTQDQGWTLGRYADRFFVFGGGAHRAGFLNDGRFAAQGRLFGNAGDLAAPSGNGLGRITVSTAAPTGGSQGDIWCVY